MANVANGSWWRLAEDGILYIYCVGDMPNYTESSGDTIPWGGYWTRITSVIIQDGVTSVGNYAFNTLINLVTATISDGITKIGDSAFESCFALSSIIIPSSVASIGVSAFVNCNALTDVYYTGARYQWDAITKGSGNDVLSSATIHANYMPTPTYTVTFNPNGGNPPYPTNSKTVTQAEPYGTLPGTARSNYQFDGWYTAATGGTKITSDTIVDLSDNQTLYAQWTYVPPTQTVVFNANGGTGTMSKQEITAGTPQVLNPNTFTRNGYSFKNWNTSSDGSGTTYVDGAVYSTPANAYSGTVSMYAQWELLPFDIEITTPPRKTTYTSGDIFDPSGMTVIIEYSDGRTEELTENIVTPDTPLALTDTSVVISCTANEVTKSFTIPITVNPNAEELAAMEAERAAERNAALARMYHSITIGAYNTWTAWRLIPASRPVVNPPEVKTNFVDVPGADGALDFTEALDGKIHYKNREGSWEFIICHEQIDVDTGNTYHSANRWAELYHDILQAIHGKRLQVILMDEFTPGGSDNRFYVGRVWVNSFRSDPHHSKIVFDYELEPYRYLTTSDAVNKINGVL